MYLVFVNILVEDYRVTKEPNPRDGLLDITIVKNFSFLIILFNIHKLYNGKIVHHNKVTTYKVKEFKIEENTNSIIEADGEIIGTWFFKSSHHSRMLFNF